MKEAPLIGISRLRMGTDGRGVTTLVAFHGCPLHCKYCLNPHCNTTEGIWNTMTPQQVYDEVKKDALYFTATNGGITFGGGEPMLRADFIKEVLKLGANKWHISLETSLNVGADKNWEMLRLVDHYYIDVKDMNPEIYKRYTRHDMGMLMSNLQVLQSKVASEKITIRLPLIKGYNTDEDRDRSEEQLRRMGFEDIQRFDYITNIPAHKQRMNRQTSKV